MKFSIREHCIPASDELSRIRKISEIPKELEGMEEKTAGGIVAKLKAVLESDFFQTLPMYATIKSGVSESYSWVRSEREKEMREITSILESQ